MNNNNDFVHLLVYLLFTKTIIMKLFRGLLLMLAFGFFFISCEQHKSPKEKVKDGMEEVKDGVKESAESVKKEVKDASEDLKDGVDETAKKVKKDLD